MSEEESRLPDPGLLRRVRAAVEAVQAAPPGTLPRAEIVDVLRDAAVNGTLTIDFAATEALGHPLVLLTRDGRRSEPPWLARLTTREREVAALLARGDSNRTIAARLVLSLATVKDHVHHILEKSGLPGRAALAAELAGLDDSTLRDAVNGGHPSEDGSSPQAATRP